MSRTKSRASQRNSSFTLHLVVLAAVAAAFLFSAAILPIPSVTAQTGLESNGCRIGERLTYNVKIGRYPNAAYAELYCVSRGRLGDKDAVELRAKFRTLDLASAALFLVDESRTTFFSPLTWLPLYTSVSQNAFGLPKETIQNFISIPTLNADLLTLIYRLRQSGGAGSMTMQDGEKVYTVSFQPGVTEKQKTDAGEFETTVVLLQSEYFTEHGITDVRVNLSNDDAKLPVVVRFRTSKGALRAGLVSVQTAEPEVVAQPVPTLAKTPVVERTPKPVATPTPYIDNQPLPPELTFELGERLEYKILSGPQQVAVMYLAAKERKQINGLDTLVLEATFSDIRPGAPFVAGDFVRANVNPDTLAPRQFEMRFAAGGLRPFTSTVKFEKEGSAITVGTNRVEAPVGTHSVLSLLYALRSFNLKPSLDLNNPINDTRVAVFWESKPYIFTLRPSAAEVITLDGKAVAAQPVSVSTKNSLLDQMNIKIWLGNDDTRVPLRFALGQYQADLVSVSKIQPN